MGTPTGNIPTQGRPVPPKRPTPTQKAVLRELAAARADGQYAAIETEINGSGREHTPRLAVKNGETRYIEDRPLAIQTVRTLREAGWIAETKRWTTGEVRHGRKQWHTEHVEAQITEAGRTALLPRRKPKSTSASAGANATAKPKRAPQKRKRT